MTAKENPAWVFNPAYPPQPIWGFTGNTPDATTPGPTLFARYGRPMICRIHNQLPYDHVGFGTPEITTHLHNLHTPSESDGFPGDYYGPHPDQQGPTLSAPGEFLDHFYPNILAGYDEFHGMPGYDYRRSARGPGDAVVPRPHPGFHQPERLPRHGRVLPALRRPRLGRRKGLLQPESAAAAEPSL